MAFRSAAALCLLALCSVRAQEAAAPGPTPLVAPKDCGPGAMASSPCCVCKEGWQLDKNGACTECAPGFWGSKYNICTNNRPGSPCWQGKAFVTGEAELGCGKNGQCTVRVNEQGLTEHVFPCVSQPKTSTCAPSGPTIYTPFPNRPVVGDPFNILVIGCGLEKSDRYLIIPEAKDCLNMNNNMFEDRCIFEGGDVVPDGNCTNGVMVLGGLNTPDYDQVRKSNTRQTIENVQFNEDFMDVMVGNKFHVCYPSTMVAESGDLLPVWRALSGHNEHVSRRDDAFEVDDVGAYLRGAALGAAIDGLEVCCEGLKLGDWCLPLWVFLLLWLLMACCLCCLLLAMRRSNKDLDEYKNNLKYEKFAADAEMLDLAAQQDEMSDADL